MPRITTADQWVGLDSLLQEYIEEGLSFSQIAEILNQENKSFKYTRSSVAGRVWRLRRKGKIIGAKDRDTANRLGLRLTI